MINLDLFSILKNKKIKKYKIDYFCLGLTLLKNIKYINGKAITVGSVRNNSSSSSKKKRIISFISQFRNEARLMKIIFFIGGKIKN